MLKAVFSTCKKGIPMWSEGRFEYIKAPFRQVEKVTFVILCL